MAYTGRVIVGNFKVIYLAPRHFFIAIVRMADSTAPLHIPTLGNTGKAVLLHSAAWADLRSGLVDPLSTVFAVPTTI